MKYTADFETTTNPDDCRVWAWAVCSIDTLKVYIGTDIESFITHIFSLKSPTIYFHNLAFDGEFIVNWLYRNGFTHTRDKMLYDMEFTTIISDMGKWYSLKIKMEGKLVTILDSLKIIPLSIDEIAKAYHLPIAKLNLDYTKDRPKGWVITDEEKEYIKHDVMIAAMALKEMFNEGLNKITIGSNALNFFKQQYGKDRFEKVFPMPDYDSDIRQAYRGGYTYLKKGLEGVVFGSGLVLDVNSLYPSVMYDCYMPYGEGRYFTGRGEICSCDLFNLYIQHFTCQFDLKEGHLPTIQLKHHMSFQANEYVESSKGQDIELCLTNVDLDLFLEHYNVYDIEWIDGWKFRSSKDIFKPYIDYWTEKKITAGKEGNKGLRNIAKLMLNNLYGKYAKNPRIQSKIPELVDGVVKYRLTEPEMVNPVYIPVGVFVTAWARNKTIRTGQKLYDRFIYSDTDSLHLMGAELPDGIEIDDFKLGAWALEKEFTRAKFLHQKCYIEEVDGKLEVTCAGLPKQCHSQVTFDNFEIGAKYSGKLRPKHVAGGIILEETFHTLRG